MVVGDSDQSIYAFRGATIRNIHDFESDFPGARTIMLEQNYRSTQTILNAANAVIVQNEGRKPKSLWSDAGDGELIIGYVADTEHDEAQFVAGEIDRLRDGRAVRYGDVAVFYRTNAQSRTFEEVFIRVGLPYKVVGGVRFYERREVRDAIAYLRAIANRTDDVSLRRILNVPKRGIGDKAEGAVADAGRPRADQLRRRAAPGATRSRAGHPVGQPAHRVRRVHGRARGDGGRGDAGRRDPDQRAGEVRLPDRAAATPRTRRTRPGWRTCSRADHGGPGVRRRGDAGRAGRLRSHGRGSGRAHRRRAGGAGRAHRRGPADRRAGRVDAAGDPAADEDGALSLAAGAPEPDPSLGAFLERVALVADSDQIPDSGASPPAWSR